MKKIKKVVAAVKKVGTLVRDDQNDGTGTGDDSGRCLFCLV